MKFVFSSEQRRHNPHHFLSSGAQKPNPEVPERVTRLLTGARANVRDEAFGVGR